MNPNEPISYYDLCRIQNSTDEQLKDILNNHRRYSNDYLSAVELELETRETDGEPK